ncbi:hypothetical protein SBA4_360006 [Candidatus Sulfopaludibacter sp. SbA4]|nr:hypothetical protein SBA4_360006 [Candidatus Sulfopaludibacter sp. SbA4]
MPSGTGHREVSHAVQIDVQHLVYVAGNHVAHSVPLGELVKGELRIGECGVDKPGRAVREDELHGLGRVGLQIGIEERQLGVRQFVGAAVVENREVRGTVIEAIVRGVRGELAKELFGTLRPDVVVARDEIQGILAVRGDDPLPLAPLLLRGRVVAALDVISDAQHEGRMQGGGLAPHLFEDAGLGFAGAVAQDHEAERVRRGGSRESGQRKRGQGKRKCRENQEPSIPRHPSATVARRHRMDRRRTPEPHSHPKMVGGESLRGYSRVMTRLAVALALVPWAVAQTTPNFSGVWELNQAQSKSSGHAPDRMRCKIDQQGSTFAVTFRVTARGETQQETQKYAIGQESKTEMHGAPMTSHAEWDGATLAVRSVAVFAGKELRLADRWSLSADGNTLTFAERHQYGADPEAEDVHIPTRKPKTSISSTGGRPSPGSRTRRLKWPKRYTRIYRSSKAFQRRACGQ